MAPIMMTLEFSHRTQDPVRFLAFTVETSSTAQFLKVLAGTTGGLASHPGLATELSCELGQSLSLCRAAVCSGTKRRWTERPAGPLSAPPALLRSSPAGRSQQRHLEAGPASALRNMQPGSGWACPSRPPQPTVHSLGLSCFCLSPHQGPEAVLDALREPVPVLETRDQNRKNHEGNSGRCAQSADSLLGTLAASSLRQLTWFLKHSCYPHPCFTGEEAEAQRSSANCPSGQQGWD